MPTPPALSPIRSASKPQQGFTLMEMLVVLALIAILATMAAPSQTGRLVQQQIVETLELVGDYQQSIAAMQMAEGHFPANNAAAAIPDADKITGNYLSQAVVDNGALHLHLGQKIAPSQLGKIVSLRPVYVEGSPGSPVSWVCGFDTVPDGMLAAGDNLTNLEQRFLPLRCR